MHALIIEDDPGTALMIDDELRASGFTSVAFAVTEEEAIASAAARCPDLVTCSVDIPEGCGIAAVESICDRRAIRVLYITTSMAEVCRRVIDPILIAKPFLKGTVCRMVADAMSDGRPAAAAGEPVERSIQNSFRPR